MSVSNGDSTALCYLSFDTNLRKIDYAEVSCDIMFNFAPGSSWFGLTDHSWSFYTDIDGEIYDIFATISFNPKTNILFHLCPNFLCSWDNNNGHNDSLRLRNNRYNNRHNGNNGNNGNNDNRICCNTRSHGIDQLHEDGTPRRRTEDCDQQGTWRVLSELPLCVKLFKFIKLIQFKFKFEFIKLVKFFKFTKSIRAAIFVFILCLLFFSFITFIFLILVLLFIFFILHSPSFPLSSPPPLSPASS